MARSYKRDKNGRFASGGGGGGGLATTGTKQSAVKQRGNINAGGSQKKQREYLAGSSMEKTSRTLRRSEIQRAGLGDKSYAGKVSTTRSGNSVSPTKSSGASGRGKSLRKSVQAKRSVAATTKANGGPGQMTAKTIKGGDSGKKVLKGATYRDSKAGYAAAGKVSAAAAASLGPYHKPTTAATKKSNQLLAESHRKSIAASSAKSGSHRLFGKKK